MKSVSLALSNKSEEKFVAVAQFSDADIDILTRYISYVDRLQESKLLERGIPKIQNLSISGEAGLVVTCGSYTNAELYEILHLLRPLILQDEKTSFHKVSALINNRFRDPHVGSHLKYVRRIFENGELSLYFQLSVAKQPIFDESLLKLWLNAEQYHTDPEKIIEWAPIKNALRLENERAVIISLLGSKVKAIHELAYIAELITRTDAV